MYMAAKSWPAARPSYVPLHPSSSEKNNHTPRKETNQSKGKERKEEEKKRNSQPFVQYSSYYPLLYPRARRLLSLRLCPWRWRYAR